MYFCVSIARFNNWYIIILYSMLQKKKNNCIIPIYGFSFASSSVIFDTAAAAVSPKNVVRELVCVLLSIAVRDVRASAE